MPTTKDVESLIEGMTNGNWEQIVDVSSRIAKKLQKQGHNKDADYIRELTSRRDMPKYLHVANSDNWYHVSKPKTKLDELIVPEEIKKQINQIFKEYDKRQLLKDNGLSNSNKILLVGQPGTGKTMTAEILANGLNLPLKTVRQETLIESRMGKTANNLATIMPTYQEAGVFPAVYFFDEFDTLASKRISASSGNEREYNEITNVLLKEMDHINPDCFMVCATNLVDGFDPAVFRRFDMIIRFPNATPQTVKKLLTQQLSSFTSDYVPSIELCRELEEFPLSVIKAIALDAEKRKLLDNTPINDDLIRDVAKNKRK